MVKILMSTKNVPEGTKVFLFLFFVFKMTSVDILAKNLQFAELLDPSSAGF